MARTRSSVKTAGVVAFALITAAASSIHSGIADAGPGASGVLDVRIAAGADDVEQFSGGTMYLNSSDLELVDASESSGQTIGLRYPGLDIPQGAIITTAHLAFTVDETTSVPTQLTIAAHDTDNSPAFTTTSNNLTARARTAATTLWQPPAWNTSGVSGPDQTTPDIRASIQAVINRAGWTPGNALGFTITGTGSRIAVAHNAKPSQAPLLHIEYTTNGTAPNNAPTITNATATPDVATIGDTINLTATINDDGLPNPPATTTTLWTQTNGPAPATINNPNTANTTATFTTPGIYQLDITANDNELTTTKSVTITIGDGNPAPSGVLDVRIAAGADDVEQFSGGTMYLNSSDLELVDASESSGQTIGLRYPGLDIPQGAIITTAHLAFTVDETTSVPTQLTIAAHDTDNSPAFTTTSNNLTARARTAATTLWQPPAWNTSGVSGPDQTTPDIRASIQAVINRAGWTPGNALGFTITGTGSRIAVAHNAKPSQAPLLHIEYTTNGTAPNNAPTITNATATPDVATIGDTINLTATINDDGLPNPPATTTTLWTQTNGPAPATINNPNTANTTATFTTPGIYQLDITANDNELTTTKSVTITIGDGNPAPSGVLDVRIAAGADDVEQFSGGTMYLNSSDLELVDASESSGQTIGLRYPGLDIPQGAIITTAHLAFTVDETTSVPTQLTIAAHDTDNSPAFTTTSNNLTARARTAATTLWQPPAWNTSGVSGPDQTTPDIRASIQAVINRAGWTPGNALGFTITGTGSRIAVAHNAKPSQAPLLHIEYTTNGTAPNNAPTITNATATPDVATIGDTINLTATINDDGLPNPPATTTTLWTQTNGPAPATINNPNTANTTATFTTPGIYQLDITANDNELSVTQSFTITVLDESGSIPGDLLPDLISDPAVRQQITIGDMDFPELSDRLLLKFDGFVTNVGDGPFHMEGNPQHLNPNDPNDHDVWQWALGADGEFHKLRQVPILYETDDDHDHFHLMQIVHYGLWDSNGPLAVEVAPGRKVGFCIYDTEIYPGFQDAAPQTYSRETTDFCSQGQEGSSQLMMGVSKGWRDVYDTRTNFQWIDITDVNPGEYWLSAEADPDNVVVEKDENNPIAFAEVSAIVPGFMPAPLSVAVPAGSAVPIDLPATQFVSQTYGAPTVGQAQFVITDAPAHGQLSVTAGTPFSAPSITYTPDPGYVGPDTFTYGVRDSTSTFPNITPTDTISLTVG